MNKWAREVYRARGRDIHLVEYINITPVFAILTTTYESSWSTIYIVPSNFYIFRPTALPSKSSHPSSNSSMGGCWNQAEYRKRDGEQGDQLSYTIR